MWRGIKANDAPLCRADVTNERSYICTTPLRLHGVRRAESHHIFFLLVKELPREIVLSTVMGKCEFLYAVVDKEADPNE
jgi:hypothetical protein